MGQHDGNSGTVFVLNSVAAPSNASVSVSQIVLGICAPGEWDRNAMRAEASMRSAYAHLRGLRYKYFLKGAPKIFGIFHESDGQRTQIGHATIVLEFGTTRFYDGINLYPEFRQYWTEAMTLLLRACGRGTYEYGWQWVPEKSREDELRSIAGVENLNCRNILVQGVDFANWPDWDSYYRDISTNVRYDARKIVGQYRDLHLEIVTGLRALLKIPILMGMRQALYRRKKLPFHSTRVLLGYILSIVFCPPQAIIAMAVGDDRVRAIHSNSEFGQFHYHLDAAAADGATGEGRFLQLAVIKRAYDLTPQGKFLVGYTDLPIEEQSAKGLLQSRRFLRVSDWPSSIIRFDWKA